MITLPQKVSDPWPTAMLWGGIQLLGYGYGVWLLTRERKIMNNPVLRLRAIDAHGSDKAWWELRREAQGYVWWYWPAGLDWDRVRGIPTSRTAGRAEEEARSWFSVHEPDLIVEITAGLKGEKAK